MSHRTTVWALSVMDGSIWAVAITQNGQLSILQTRLLCLPAHTAGLTYPNRTTLANVPAGELSDFVSRNLNVFVYYKHTNRLVAATCSHPDRLVTPRLQEPYVPFQALQLSLFFFLIHFCCVLYRLLQKSTHIFFFLLIIQYCNIFNIK